MSRRVRPRHSHARLLLDVTAAAAPTSSSRRGRLDAVIVPTARPASSLRPVIALTARLGVPVLFLCSQQATVDQVSARLLENPSAEGLVVKVPEGHAGRLPALLGRSAGTEFDDANGHRTSDLSLKRNLGLLIARLRGWSKVMFVDDDITHIRPADIGKLAAQLDRHPVAGMVCREFPDNSVACHARRLAGQPQDNFVSGAVLGVNTSDHPLSFFPDIYNEDWFFFSRAAAGRTLPMVGQARQAEYDPYARPGRAVTEEFGDLLAEGLYAIFDSMWGWTFKDQLSTANESYWRDFITARGDALRETAGLLAATITRDERTDLPMHAALRSLDAAQEQLGRLSPTMCVNFIEAWQADLDHWQDVTTGINRVATIRGTFEELGLDEWRSCRLSDSTVGYRRELSPA